MKTDATGTIFEIQRFCVHDGPGIRTTVFFKGCPLRCKWCHNPEGLDSAVQLGYRHAACAGCGQCERVCARGVHQLVGNAHRIVRERGTLCGRCVAACPTGALRMIGQSVTALEVVKQALRDRPFYGTQGGITCSGGECAMQPDFLLAVLKHSKENGLHTAVDTCGLAPQATFERIMPYTDAFLYDIKAVSPKLHHMFTGADNRVILDNYAWLMRHGARVEVRVPLVPTFNDTAEGIEKIAGFMLMAGVPSRVKVIPYHAPGKGKYAMLGLSAWPLDARPGLSPEDAQRILDSTLYTGQSGL